MRTALEAEGWSVAPRRRNGVFGAEHEDERLTVVISSGSEPQQISAAYKRLLEVHTDDADRRLAIVLPRQVQTGARDLGIDPGDPLKVNIFVVDESGFSTWLGIGSTSAQQPARRSTLPSSSSACGRSIWRVPSRRPTPHSGAGTGWISSLGDYEL